MTHGRTRRVVLRNSLDAAYDASDAWHRRQRSFRNIIVLATAGITVLLVLVGLLVFFNPSYMPFCFEDIQQAEGAPAVPSRRRPRRRRSKPWLPSRPRAARPARRTAGYRRLMTSSS